MKQKSFIGGVPTDNIIEVLDEEEEVGAPIQNKQGDQNGKKLIDISGGSMASPETSRIDPEVESC